MSTSSTAIPTATIVPKHRRPEFPPAIFGRSLMIIGEFAVYSFMERLSPLDYREFYEQDGKPLFAFSHLSFQHRSQLLPEGYARLHAYLAGHPEASEILQAID